MAVAPLELVVPLSPRARFDILDVRARATALHGDRLDAYRLCVYSSLHTTAGYLDQSLASRLSHRRGVSGYISAFRTLFPEGAGYRHDALEERRELSRAARRVEPRNADSHLAFMAAGLRTCVTYRNRPQAPVYFVDLDGMQSGRPRQRQASVVGYTREIEVERIEVDVPVSSHPIDSVNLKDPRLGLYDRLGEVLTRQGVTKGRLRLDLAPGERQTGLTVNEYETLLMRHDLIQVLRDPLRFMAEKGRHVLADPRSVPVKTLAYAKYDLVRAFNEIVETLGLSESLVERVVARALAVPAERFFRMKRTVDLLVSDRDTPGRGAIVEGPYQSPILVQWSRVAGRVRRVEATLVRFE